jgi:hypothetical protein
MRSIESLLSEQLLFVIAALLRALVAGTLSGPRALVSAMAKLEYAAPITKLRGRSYLRTKSMDPPRFESPSLARFKETSCPLLVVISAFVSAGFGLVSLKKNQLRFGVGMFGPECPRISQNNGADLLWQPHGTDIPSPQMQDPDILRVQSQGDNLCFRKVNLR